MKSAYFLLMLLFLAACTTTPEVVPQDEPVIEQPSVPELEELPPLAQPSVIEEEDQTYISLTGVKDDLELVSTGLDFGELHAIIKIDGIEYDTVKGDVVEYSESDWLYISDIAQQEATVVKITRGQNPYLIANLKPYVEVNGDIFRFDIRNYGKLSSGNIADIEILDYYDEERLREGSDLEVGPFTITPLEINVADQITIFELEVTEHSTIDVTFTSEAFYKNGELYVINLEKIASESISFDVSQVSQGNSFVLEGTEGSTKEAYGIEFGILSIGSRVATVSIE